MSIAAAVAAPFDKSSGSTGAVPPEAPEPRVELVGPGIAPGVPNGRKLGLLKPQFLSIYDANTNQDFGIISLKTAAGATQ